MEDLRDTKNIKIYLNCIEEIKKRLFWMELLLKETIFDKRIITESVVLQLRKVLELIALAAITPNKNKYEKFRLSADEPKDFRKDYHGRKILEMLKKINPYFYPRPLGKPVLKDQKIKHFESFNGEYLTIETYISIYDKCGKFLHADNPWDNKKPYNEFKNEIPKTINLIYNLLNLHGIIIIDNDNNETTSWIVELGNINNLSKGYIALANGPVFIDDNYYKTI